MSITTCYYWATVILNIKINSEFELTTRVRFIVKCVDYIYIKGIIFIKQPETIYNHRINSISNIAKETGCLWTKNYSKVLWQNNELMISFRHKCALMIKRECLTLTIFTWQYIMFLISDYTLHAFLHFLLSL